MPGKSHYNHFFTPRSHRQSVFFDDDRSDSDLDVYEHTPLGAGARFYETRTSRHDGHGRSKYESRRRHPTDAYFDYDQVPPSVYEEADSPKRSRARRASASARTPQKPPKPTTTTNLKTPPKATEEDAIRAGIPAGFSIKNWDPTEAPILLLGSVFDANSLGKWIYDWTIFHYGATAPMSDVAGDLWLLLIKLAGKVKRADECAPLIRCRETREMVEDFLESGERLWCRFKKLLKACEYFMWKAAKRESGKNSVTMGRNAGCEFVDSIFGRDRELENTEKLMNSIRLWNMRFDANCEEILRRPTEALCFFDFVPRFTYKLFAVAGNPYSIHSTFTVYPVLTQRWDSSKGLVLFSRRSGNAFGGLLVCIESYPVRKYCLTATSFLGAMHSYYSAIEAHLRKSIRDRSHASLAFVAVMNTTNYAIYHPACLSPESMTATTPF
ncbi:hypothetical protein CISG_04288 [Coccidioides immitis RMSCC 3703]|uniref:Vegetative cell wall protein gp1 n=1 Tax=Coccidioides immitis RMSCC 3703 TaxID=454286 RepID=A0A0J8QQ72_COCIT|nr:hypothetical protein CISG_04288 [Coccidioides immitis RMSCC 3703]